MEKECTKCDERGMIADPNFPGASSSCTCGKYSRLMQDKFKGAKIEDLFNYLEARRIQRGRYLPGEPRELSEKPDPRDADR